ncbi:hypothetical protein XELAEV_18011239mg [Xenopus laevis]|uniref:Uncharacterized protein n=1 Tax=Xenopus laevis TaxID=8355 RepID=A0A974DMN4_XENLA|nr:hypothetical protein XELAEV_18011239mg [Xenopus laevis]
MGFHGNNLGFSVVCPKKDGLTLAQGWQVLSDPVICARSTGASIKAVLLIYGCYLAGLTNNISSPPVIQSLAIMVGNGLVMAGTGVVFLLLQSRQFEEEQVQNTQMTKYFSSPSKSFRSMYSEEQIYHLLGENTSMRKLLSEKNGIIESLQEQVSNAKGKLMNLLKSECSFETIEVTGLSVLSASTLANQHHVAPEHMKIIEEPAFLDTVENMEEHEAVIKDTQEGDNKHDTEWIFSLKTRGHINIRLQKSPHQYPGELSERTEVLEQLSRKVNYVSSEKLQEILKELTIETMSTCGHQSPKEGFQKLCISLSPYMKRRRPGPCYSQRNQHHSHHFPNALPPQTWCFLNKEPINRYNGEKSIRDERPSQTGEERTADVNMGHGQHNPSLLTNTMEPSVHGGEENRTRVDNDIWMTPKHSISHPPDNPPGSIRKSLRRHSEIQTRAMVTLADLRSQTPYTETDSSSSEGTIAIVTGLTASCAFQMSMTQVTALK